jgi:predicted 3-demethylubiquinone-9 3-methyltransferase (glyoxalase superfamily)
MPVLEICIENGIDIFRISNQELLFFLNLKTKNMSSVKSSQNIIPFLWFDGKAEEAMKLYTSLFPNSFIKQSKKWGEGSQFPSDWIMMGSIVIDGLEVHLFDAGPQFKFNESVSFFVNCKTQEEIDKYWNILTTDGGAESQCGWLKDKFGFSWQLVPAFLSEKLANGDPRRLGQMMQSLWSMKKLIIADLEKAYNSDPVPVA